MSELLVGFFLGAGASILASLVMILLLRWTLSPRIEIDDFVRCGTNAVGKPTIKFRITNRSFRQAIEIKIVAHRVRDEVDGSNTYSSIRKIPLVTDDIAVLEAYDRKLKRTDYYSVLSSRSSDGRKNIQKVFEESQSTWIRLRVIATDPYSNVRKVFTKRYEKKDLKDGAFGKRSDGIEYLEKL
ncbi:hypothetical protein ABFT80_03015 [Mesorhizobium sp. SB112]|uniref:hypothetical protein n=1 Tax=Mesorhizobium sp. SB112 TaxID=3151853 RepID=UPI0032633B87